MNGERIGSRLAGELAAATPMPLHTEPGREAPRGASRLAIPVEIERSWGDAAHEAIASLDRFESAVVFAIREAARLKHKRQAIVTQIEVAGR